MARASAKRVVTCPPTLLPSAKSRPDKSSKVAMHRQGPKCPSRVGSTSNSQLLQLTVPPPRLAQALVGGRIHKTLSSRSFETSSASPLLWPRCSTACLENSSTLLCQMHRTRTSRRCAKFRSNSICSSLQSCSIRLLSPQKMNGP